MNNIDRRLPQLPSSAIKSFDGLTCTRVEDANNVLAVGAFSDIGEICKGLLNLARWAQNNSFADEIHLDCRIRITECALGGTDTGILRVIFNEPATVIYWNDGTKTVVKCQPGDSYDREKGFIAAYMKKLLGNNNQFNKVIKKWVTE